MVNSKQLLREFVSKLTLDRGADELSAIGHVVLENVFKISRPDLLRDTQIQINEAQQHKLDVIAQRLNTNEPLQYVLNEAHFYGRTFYVDPAVLIPRPETEELVSLVIDRCRGSKRRPKILDIGTGSGCIPITLALEIPGSTVSGLDKSKSALAVAERNAKALGANAKFFEHDILGGQLPLDSVDVIVSNPPYIPLQEMSRMHANVTDFEPHLALFVENTDPFIFYSAIARIGKKILNPDGFIAVEINERFGNETRQVFVQEGYKHTETLKDMAGKDRFVVAQI
ncbi:MAG TPA: peptide chain release factor N(5)-glutamine methyltransferase [Chryseosolibacter sp.]